MQPLRSLSGGILLLGLLGASPALAHVDLLEPEARAHGTAAGATADDVNTNQKTGPCGQVTNGRTDRVTTYAPGETITLQVREETPHDSYIRVSLDLDGDTFPLRPVAATPAETEEVALAAEEALGGDTLLRVFRESNNTPNFVHEIEVTLPNQTCTNCTLQVIQFMYGAGNPFYFQCADLVIAGDAAAGADAGAAPIPATAGTGGVTAQGAGGSVGSVPTEPVGNSGGTGGADGAGVAAPGTGGTAVTGAAGNQNAGSGGGMASSDDEDDDGGCSLPASGSGQGSSGLFAVLALGLALLRRRS